jgi:hypothetical protein
MNEILPALSKMRRVSFCCRKDLIRSQIQMRKHTRNQLIARHKSLHLVLFTFQAADRDRWLLRLANMTHRAQLQNHPNFGLLRTLGDPKKTPYSRPAKVITPSE